MKYRAKWTILETDIQGIPRYGTNKLWLLKEERQKDFNTKEGMDEFIRKGMEYGLNFARIEVAPQVVEQETFLTPL